MVSSSEKLALRTEEGLSVAATADCAQAEVRAEVEAYEQMWHEKLVRKEDERTIIVERLEEAGVDVLALYKQLEPQTAVVATPQAKRNRSSRFIDRAACAHLSGDIGMGRDVLCAVGGDQQLEASGSSRHRDFGGDGDARSSRQRASGEGQSGA